MGNYWCKQNYYLIGINKAPKGRLVQTQSVFSRTTHLSEASLYVILLLLLLLSYHQHLLAHFVSKHRHWIVQIKSPAFGCTLDDPLGPGRPWLSSFDANTQVWRQTTLSYYLFDILLMIVNLLLHRRSDAAPIIHFITSLDLFTN